MGGVKKFKELKLSRQKNELARFKVISGVDYGSVYAIFVQRCSIGRGEGCDIMLSDLKASRIHAELLASPKGWSVRDFGSANGIWVNGAQAHQSELRTGDVLVVGDTVLEFFGADANDAMLELPPKSAEQVVANQKALERKNVRIKALTTVGGLPKKGPRPEERPWASPALPASGQSTGLNRRMILWGVVGSFAFYTFFMMDESQPTKKTVQNKVTGTTVVTRAPAGSVVKQISNEVKKSAEQFFRAGFREYREMNFLRAKTRFETVLQIDPSHQLARIYLENCNQAIKEEVQFHLDQGRKAREAGRLEAARGHFEAILRLLFRDQKDPTYEEALDQLKQIEDSMQTRQ